MHDPVRNYHIERIISEGQLACVAGLDLDELSYSLSAGIGQGGFWSISRLILLQPEVDTYGTSEWDATCCSGEKQTPAASHIKHRFGTRPRNQSEKEVTLADLDDQAPVKHVAAHAEGVNKHDPTQYG